MSMHLLVFISMDQRPQGITLSALNGPHAYIQTIVFTTDWLTARSIVVILAGNNNIINLMKGT
jgi:hypothetical protein